MKKTLILIMSLLLIFSFVNAKSYTYPVTHQYEKLSDYKVNPTSSTKTTTPTSSSGIPTRWVYNGKECVKADVLSIPYKVSPSSKIIIPHIVVGYDNYGRKIVQRILSGEKKVTLDPKTKRYVKDPVCDTSKIESTLINYDWMRV